MAEGWPKISRTLQHAAEGWRSLMMDGRKCPVVCLQLRSATDLLQTLAPAWEPLAMEIVLDG